ncbi:hypothetical protein DFH11DRAFT_388874 [Phellopilus nigrolimitatus]|nr:hypothetical protein DFH11DRAFT_388874 [Phellopilus nigrolimitatus]
MALPFEVLDMIFELAEIRPYARTRQTILMLLSLLRVCRTWRHVAERRLYQSISIHGESLRHIKNRGWSWEDIGKPTARMLIKTLETPRLATLVHDLSLTTTDFLDDRILTELYVKLISMCPKLAYVTISGFNNDLRGELKEVLLGKKDLVWLKISKSIREDHQGDFFCDTVELIGMMTHWPRLQKLYFGENMLCGSDYSEPFPAPSSVLCPQLRGYCISSACLNERDVDALQVVTGRRLEIFIATIEDTKRARVALLRCLAAWAPCLTNVTLDVSYGSKLTKMDRSIAAAFPVLRSLKVLRLETGLVRPSTVLELPALECLEYIILPTDHTEVSQALASGLEVSGTKSGGACRLPMLRRITLEFLCDPPFKVRVSQAILDHLNAVCTKRKIDLNYRVKYPTAGGRNLVDFRYLY